MSRHVSTLVLSSLLFTGCTSISSTLVNRTDSDIFIGNSNGNVKSHCQARPFKGVPITLRVPTHLDIAVKETIFLRPTDDKSELVRVRTPKRHLFVEANLVETDKVFAVDVKRPAAGTLDYTMEFGDNANNLDNSQYFKEIKNKIADKTIQDVTTALETVVPSLQKLAATPTTAGSDLKDVIQENRVVAWKRFDLDTHDFEQQVGMFLEQHLNCCNSCREYRDNNSRLVSPPAPHPQLPPAK